MGYHSCVEQLSRNRNEMSHGQLTLKQRFQIETFLEEGWSQKAIALRIRVNPSTVSRELSRFPGAVYDARKAQAQSVHRRQAAKRSTKVLLTNATVYAYVEKKLKLYWSPEQIVGRGGEECSGMVCHETIYRFIYKEKPEWKTYLRQKKGKYRRRHGTKARERAREEAKKKRIDAREGVVETRERLGDWEGDTIVGGERTTGILTHVERRSGYLLADLLKRKSAHAVQAVTVRRFSRLPKSRRRTVTYDNGLEFAEHEQIERATKMAVYFAYPYHSWERGTNENTNGLLRQFFPKQSLFAKLTQQDVDRAVRCLNHRPRKRLGYLTPHEVFVLGKPIAIQGRI